MSPLRRDRETGESNHTSYEEVWLFPGTFCYAWVRERLNPSVPCPGETNTHTHANTHRSLGLSSSEPSSSTCITVYIPHSFCLFKSICALGGTVAPLPTFLDKSYGTVHTIRHNIQDIVTWSQSQRGNARVHWYILHIWQQNISLRWKMHFSFKEVSSLFFPQLTLRPSFAFHKEVVAL